MHTDTNKITSAGRLTADHKNEYLKMSEAKDSASIVWPNMKIQQAIWLQQVATEGPNETTIKD